MCNHSDALLDSKWIGFHFLTFSFWLAWPHSPSKVVLFEEKGYGLTARVAI
jgi:hypothetical protein